MADTLRIGQIGNFSAPHSTENHVRQAWERNGHTVLRLQENTLAAWEAAKTADVDLVMWTRTGWDWPAACGITWEQAMAMQQDTVDALRSRGVPIVGFHLDRWWGLDREGQIDAEVYFKACSLLVTAEGGREAEWAAAGVNHAWLPPGVSLAECERPMRRGRNPYANTPVVFVGSWQHYHPEWLPYRQELVRTLTERYGRRFAALPKPGTRALRGAHLTELYGAAKVAVGDSCLAGGVREYVSDRVPECLGRGGFLIHPHVDGVFPEHWQDGEHLVTYPVGDFPALLEQVDRYLADDEANKRIRQAGREHTMRHHTYERRCEQIVDLMRKRGML